MYRVRGREYLNNNKYSDISFEQLCYTQEEFERFIATAMVKAVNGIIVDLQVDRLDRDGYVAEVFALGPVKY